MTMRSDSLHRTISSFMLLVITICMTSSAVGEFRSHTLPTNYSSDSHSHDHLHEFHAVDSEHQFQHDMSSHHHSYDAATLRAVQPMVSLNWLVLIAANLLDGKPLYRPFKLERPPRSLFVE